MTRIPMNERDIIEQAMYLPMLLNILERDRMAFEKGATFNSQCGGNRHEPRTNKCFGVWGITLSFLTRK